MLAMVARCIGNLMKNIFGLSPRYLSSHEDASLSTVTLLWYVCHCPVALTCHHKVLFCVLCVCVLCMHLCTVHMHLSMHKRLTRLLARAARPGSVWECVEGGRIHVHVCLSVHVCSLIVF